MNLLLFIIFLFQSPLSAMEANNNDNISDMHGKIIYKFSGNKNPNHSSLVGKLLVTADDSIIFRDTAYQNLRELSLDTQKIKELPMGGVPYDISNNSEILLSLAERDHGTMVHNLRRQIEKCLPISYKAIILEKNSEFLIGGFDLKNSGLYSEWTLNGIVLKQLNNIKYSDLLLMKHHNNRDLLEQLQKFDSTTIITITPDVTKILDIDTTTISANSANAPCNIDSATRFAVRAIDTGKELCSLPKSWIYTFINSEKIAMVHAKDDKQSTLVVYNLNDGKYLGETPVDATTGEITTSRDGTKIFTADNKAIREWDVQTLINETE